MSTPAAEIRRPTSEDDITKEALRRTEAAKDPRFREIMLSLIKHLHSFVKDVQLTEPEWWAAIKFLTDTGHITNDVRQEWILLSDTLGVSMMVDLISHRKPEGYTESTVFGPFHRDGSPELGPGDDMSSKPGGGTLCFISGRVLDGDGQPISGAKLDCWQAAPDGMYDVQDASLEGHIHMRGIYTTDSEGRFLVKTRRPVSYPIPYDGPVGKMIDACGRHPWRPAHVHFLVSATGYESLTTHLFDSVDKYLQSDAVFGVKPSLVVEFKDHAPGSVLAKELGADVPFVTAEYDFILKAK
jgi:protocatechuate 3,4-dioxygenase beta subunit